MHKSQLKIVIILLVLAVIVLGVLLYKKSNPSVMPVVPKVTEEAKDTVVPVTITKKDIEEKYFTGSRPLIEGESMVVKEANKYIEQTVANFRTSADTDVPDMREKFGADSPTANYSIDIDAKYIKGNNTESIVVSQYTYTGGANGNSTYKVFSASLKTGKILSIDDILKTGKETAFLSLLKKKLLAWRPEGSTQSVVFESEIKNLTFESIANWSLDNTNLIIYFDKYAVGPGVLGPVAFPLPISTLTEFLVYN